MKNKRQFLVSAFCRLTDLFASNNKTAGANDVCGGVLVSPPHLPFCVHSKSKANKEALGLDLPVLIHRINVTQTTTSCSIKLLFSTRNRKVSESESVRINFCSNPESVRIFMKVSEFQGMKKFSKPESVRIWMCQNLLWPEGVRNLKCQTWMCQNRIVSEFFEIGKCQNYVNLEGVRIWMCQNWKV